ncbi:hypothetical protein BGZ54_003329, partial [Gamsiella multidivaricata]
IWKRKWFVLRTSKLAYYKDSKEYELLRIVDIRDVHRAAEVPQKHRPNVFVILTPRRTFTVQAQTHTEMCEWIQAVSEAKIQFEFTVSSSDLESSAGSTVHLGQASGTAPTQPATPTMPMTPMTPTAKVSGIILPRRQQHTPLSLSDPELLDKREKSRQKSKDVPQPSPLSCASPNYNHDFSNTNANTNMITRRTSILDQPIVCTPPASPRRVEGLSLITTNYTHNSTPPAGTGSGAGTGTQAINIAAPSSPRMEQVHSAAYDLTVGSFSSEQSFTDHPPRLETLPGTPTSPGGYYSGGEAFFGGNTNYFSSGDEDAAIDDDDNDPCMMVEAGRVASAANAPGSGIVTAEQVESKVIRQGYLLKLGNTYKTWRKKWFVLRGDKLTYYKNMKEYQPHGIIPLSTIIDCLQTDPVSKSKQYCLRIVTAKRAFVCCAPDEDTLLQWLDALQVECDRVQIEAQEEAIAEQNAEQQQGQHNHVQQDGHESDPENGDATDTNTAFNINAGKKQSMGRTARLKINFHSSLPRSRSRSKSGDAANNGSSGGGGSLFGSSIGSQIGFGGGAGGQLRKVVSLENGNVATSSTPATPTGIAPTTPTHYQPELPASSATMTSSA